MHAAVRVRIFLARHRWLSWLAIVTFTAAIGLMVHAQLREVDAARAAWGDTVPVLVASGDQQAGEVPEVERRDLPAAMLPPTALQSLPAGTTLRQRVAAGEVLTSVDITAAAGPVGGAEVDSIVVGITDPLARGAVVGSRVRISSEGVVLADTGHVVSLADEIVFVAVEVADAPMVAAAAQAGLASILFVP